MQHLLQAMLAQLEPALITEVYSVTAVATFGGFFPSAYTEDAPVGAVRVRLLSSTTVPIQLVESTDANTFVGVPPSGVATLTANEWYEVGFITQKNRTYQLRPTLPTTLQRLLAHTVRQALLP